MFDMIFREEMYSHIAMNNSEEKQNVYKALQKYLDSYGITEEDLKLDSIYRDYKRKKDKITF